MRLHSCCLSSSLSTPMDCGLSCVRRRLRAGWWSFDMGKHHADSQASSPGTAAGRHGRPEMPQQLIDCERKLLHALLQSTRQAPCRHSLLMCLHAATIPHSQSAVCNRTSRAPSSLLLRDIACLHAFWCVQGSWVAKHNCSIQTGMLCLLYACCIASHSRNLTQRCKPPHSVKDEHAHLRTCGRAGAVHAGHVAM